MLYRPNFCCQCGEKIARARWTLLTSRRFCDFCEIEQKQHDLLPKAGMAIALLVGAAGLTAYMNGNGDSADSPSERKSTAQIRPLKDAAKTVQTQPASNLVEANRSGFASVNSQAANTSQANSEQRAASQTSSTEPVHYCGAITKKGTPCTRRVKTKGRCWQHISQPAIRETRN